MHLLYLLATRIIELQQKNLDQQKAVKLGTTTIGIL